MYIVEIRSHFNNGDDYSEDHYNFETKKEVQQFITEKSRQGCDIHSVYYYPPGQDSDPQHIM